MSSFSVIFTGQGAQKTGMSLDFVEKYADSAELFQIASDKLGFSLLDLVKSEDGSLDRTENSQPALLAAEMAIYIQAKKVFKTDPSAYAGHSLGEYSALVAAEVLKFEDAIQIVRKRGQLMQSATPDSQGGMLAIVFDNLESTSYRQIVKSCGAEIANLNSSAQVVISGSADSITKSSEELAKQYPEMRLVRLNVGTPFHSSLMQGIEPAFKDFVLSFKDNINFEAASKVLSNKSGTFHKPETLIEDLVSQISASVLWVDNMNVLKSVSEQAIEFGPTRVLSKLCSSVALDAKSIYDLRSFDKAFA
jgi:malonyl CoA-acyl carrier protein transacylase